MAISWNLFCVWFCIPTHLLESTIVKQQVKWWILMLVSYWIDSIISVSSGGVTIDQFLANLSLNGGDTAGAAGNTEGKKFISNGYLAVLYASEVEISGFILYSVLTLPFVKPELNSKYCRTIFTDHWNILQQNRHLDFLGFLCCHLVPSYHSLTCWRI